jgi:hypothetical protein
MKVRINTTKHTGKGQDGGLEEDRDFTRQCKVSQDDSSILQKFWQMNKQIQRIVINEGDCMKIARG